MQSSKSCKVPDFDDFTFVTHLLCYILPKQNTEWLTVVRGRRTKRNIIISNESWQGIKPLNQLNMDNDLINNVNFTDNFGDGLMKLRGFINGQMDIL